MSMEPCPFCGQSNQANLFIEPDPETYMGEDTGNVIGYHGACRNCSAQGPFCETEDAAEREWNTRA